jgi:hypothetical protein
MKIKRPRCTKISTRLIGFGRMETEEDSNGKRRGNRYGRKTTIHQANRKAWKTFFVFGNNSSANQGCK